MDKTSQIKGCILGGAVGDALGWPIEFKSINDIRNIYGANGIQNFPNKGEITDDTQMTMFTAEALIQSRLNKNIHWIQHIREANYRWLKTQEYDIKHVESGWLKNVESLYNIRSPGTTCLNGIIDGSIGTMKYPCNDSKGNGGVMRAAACGIIDIGFDKFDVGCQMAAMTHGHPCGYYPAGMLSFIIDEILKNELDIYDIFKNLYNKLEQYPMTNDCLKYLKRVWCLMGYEVPATPETISRIGMGMCGDDAIAISLYCAIDAYNKKDMNPTERFTYGVRNAVNHSGDSDSTGSITGNILGCILGIEAIPKDWLVKLECVDELFILANDLSNMNQSKPIDSNKYLNSNFTFPPNGVY